MSAAAGGGRASEGAPLRRLCRPGQVGAGGFAGRVEATAAERTAIARLLDLERLDALVFDYAIRALPRGRFLVTGRVEARLAQACVVTLEPLRAAVAEDVAVELWPEDQLAASAAGPGEREVEIGLDSPEPLPAEGIDVGQLAYEALAGAIDPYPRAAGAALDWPGDGHDPAETGPFAALRKLKSDP